MVICLLKVGWGQAHHLLLDAITYPLCGKSLKKLANESLKFEQDILKKLLVPGSN